MTQEFFNQAAKMLHHHYGTKEQILKAIEEMKELRHVLFDVLTSPDADGIVEHEADLIDEISDVLNTVENLANIIGREQVDACREMEMRRALHQAHIALDLK